MKRGFTLLELIIVIIIIGVLATLAVPQYFRVVERGRTAEAVRILGLLRDAQMRRYAERTAFTNDLAVLDVDYTPPRFYTITVLAPGYANDNNIVRAVRNATTTPIPAGYGTYRLQIQVDGDITCDQGLAGACARLGY